MKLSVWPLCLGSLLLASAVSGLVPKPTRLDDTVNYIEPSLEPLNSHRLPNDTVPVRYDVSLTTSIHIPQFDFSGTVDITFKVVESTNRVVVNSYKQVVTSVSLRLEATAVEVLSFGLQDRFLVVNTGSMLTVGSDYILTVGFNGVHESPSEGWHYARYLYDSLPRYLTSTQFQSVFAREAFPCYDEPHYRVPFKLTMNHDAGYHALSNVDVESQSGGVTVFKDSHSMPSYLMAFVVSDFECRESVPSSKQRICAQPNRMDEIQLAQEASALILTWMETTFDEVYEKEKLDHIAIPDFDFGGMENWGLIVYHPSYLLFKEGQSTVNDKINVASVISHELAHMFFGNLITPKWWTYLWLSEGLATLYEFYAVHPSYPELRLDELYIIDVLHRILRGDATGFTRPMTYYVESPDEIERIFDGVAYLKAGSVFRMIMYAITENTFKKALQIYLNENRNSAVDETPLYAALEQAIQQDQTAPTNFINLVMDSWTLQGGFPVITVTRNYGNNDIQLHQEEFIYSTPNPDSNKIWHVPLSWTHKGNPNFIDTNPQVWLSSRDDTMSNTNLNSADWVIFNIKQTGYFRVNYDDTNWGLLITELISGDHTIFAPINRAQLIDDSNILAASGRLAASVPLELMTYLSRETDMIPLLAASNHLRNLIKMMGLSEKKNLLQIYLSQLLSKNFRDTDFFYGSDTVESFKLRSVILEMTCEAGFSECHALTRALLYSELFGGVNILNNDDRSKVYCQGLKTASESLFNLFWGRIDNLIHQNDANDQNHEEILGLIQLVGCYGNGEKIAEILNVILDDDFPYPRYRYDILQSIVVNGHVDRFMAFLKDDEQTAELKLEDIGVARLNALLIAISDTVAVLEHLDMFELILQALEITGHVIPTRVRTNLVDNQNWIENQQPKIEEWLVDKFQVIEDDCNISSTMVLSSGVMLVSIFVKLFS